MITNRRRGSTGAALVAAALALASCSGTDDGAIATDAATDSSAATGDSTTPGNAAPEETAPAEETSGDTERTGDFLSADTFEGQATSVDGQSVDLAALADKDLILWFWAPW